MFTWELYVKYLTTLFFGLFLAIVAHAQISNPPSVVVNGVTWNECVTGYYQNCTWSGGGTKQVIFGAFPPTSPSPMYDVTGPWPSGTPCYVGGVDQRDPAY